VKLACAEDDAQGEALEVFWESELDRRIFEEEGWRGRRRCQAPCARVSLGEGEAM
jgi:hypothetical protein